MSLAKLTIDIVLAGLAKWEGDLGRMTQIATKESEKMARSRAGLLAQIQRETVALEGQKNQHLALKAAIAGVGDQALRYLDALDKTNKAAAQGVSTPSAAAGGTAAAQTAAAEIQANEQRQSSSRAVLEEINKLTRAYEEQRTAILKAGLAGSVAPEAVRQQLRDLQTDKRQQVDALAEVYEQRAAAEALAGIERKAAEDRALAARKIVDAQKGLTASYREQLAALRELRDKGNLTPQQFRQAGIDLVRQQPGVAARRRDAAEAEKAAAAIERIGKTAYISRNQLLTLQYTLGDIAASAASGISPLTILLQQGGQVFDAFSGDKGGIGNVFKGLLQILTPMRLAVGYATVSVGALAYAFVQGQKQSEAFANSLVLTGNYAGVTEGRFNSIAKTVASAGKVTIGFAKEIEQALVSTGEIGPRVIAAATNAAALYAQATGKTAQEVAADFASMGQDVAKWAEAHNRALNFITFKEYDQIKALQESGRTVEAQKLVYDALNGRFSQLDANLGTLSRSLKAIKGTWSDFWDAAFDIGRPETIEQKIAAAESAAAKLNKRLQDGRSANPAFATAPDLRPQDDPSRNPAERARVALLAAGAQGDVVELKRTKILSDNAAATAAERQELTKRVIAGQDYVKQLIKEGKGVSAYEQERAKLIQQFADEDKLGKPRPQADQDAALKALKDKFTDKGAIGDANKLAKAERDRALKNVEDFAKAEIAAVEFQNSYLEKLYGQGLVSLQDFFGARKAAEQRDIQAQLDEIDEKIAIQNRLRAALKGSSAPADREQIDKEIDALNNKATDLRLQAQRKSISTNLEEAGSIKQLQDRVVEYRANLLQMAGDELGAARVRAQVTIESAKQLATQTKGRPGAITEEEIKRQTELINIANNYAEAQRRVSIVTSDAGRAEELFSLRALQNGKSIAEVEIGVGQIRRDALVQLGQLTAQVEALAAASTDPKIKEFAADLALQYAKAAEAVDPALNRLRDNAKSAGSSLVQGFTSALDSARKLSDLLPSIVNAVKQFAIKQYLADPLEGLVQSGVRKLVDLSAANVVPAASTAVTGGIDFSGIGFPAGAGVTGLATAQVNANLVAGATQASATITAAGSQAGLQITAAGSAFAEAVVAAGSAFASTVAGAGAAGAGGENAGDLLSLFFSAKGSAYAANTRAFAAGASFTNTIVSTPTLFRFFEGGVQRLGEMGEAGPEAIMPLRQASGQHGVQAFNPDGTPGAVLSLTRGAGGVLGVRLYAEGGAFANQSLASCVIDDVSRARRFAQGSQFGTFVGAPVRRFAAGGDSMRQSTYRGVAPPVNVTIEDHAGGQQRVERSTRPDGGHDLRIVIEAAVSEIERRIGTGGSTDTVIRGAYGVSRNLQRRG